MAHPESITQYAGEAVFEGKNQQEVQRLVESTVENTVMMLTDHADDMDSWETVGCQIQDLSQEQNRKVWQLLSSEMQQKYSALKVADVSRQLTEKPGSVTSYEQVKSLFEEGFFDARLFRREPVAPEVAPVVVKPEVVPILGRLALRAVEIRTRLGDWLQGYFYIGKQDKRHRLADPSGYDGIFVDDNEFRFVEATA